MHLRLILLLILSLTLAACADPTLQPTGNPGADPSDVPSDELDLTGTRWESTGVAGLDLPDDATIRMDFSTDGQVSASIACNTLSGTVAVEDGRLVTSDLFATEIGCDPDAHAADAWLADLLESRPAISRDGDTLRITSDASEVVLARTTDSADQAEPPQTTDPDGSVGFAEVDVVADEPTMPEEAQSSPVGLATDAEQQQTQWDRFTLTTPSPSFDFTDQVLLFIGFGESGSCPLVLSGLEVTGQTMRLTDSRDPAEACTADFNPRTLVLAVPRALLPDGFVTVESSGPAAIIAVEPSTEPPPATATRYGTTVTDVELQVDPASATLGSTVGLTVANDREHEVAGAPYLIVEQWTGTHFQATGLIEGTEEGVTVGPATAAELMTVATADPAFADGGWFRLTAQLEVVTDGLPDGSMDVRANLHLTDETTSTIATPRTITAGPPCPADSSCGASLFIDDVSYEQSCGLVNPDMVTEEVYATGEGTTVNVIRDVDPRVMVAWDHEQCGPPLEGRWHLMYATDARGTAEEAAAWCRVSLNGPDPAEGFTC